MTTKSATYHGDGGPVTVFHETPEAELLTAARQVRDWQLSVGWSDARLLKEFPGLGSDKTYKKLWNGNTAEMNVAGQADKYRAVLVEIEELTNADGVEPVYDDLGQVPAIMRSLGRFIAQRDMRRFFIIEGPSGAGKSKVLDILKTRQPAKVLSLVGRQRWRSLAAMLRDILALVPVIDRSTEEAKQSRARREPTLHELMELAADRLLATSRVLAIDEGQYLTGAALNFLKDLINQGIEKGVRFYVLVAAQETLWRKLEANAEEEAKQLRHNRLFRRVTLTAPTAEDCRQFLERSITFAAGEEKGIARECDALERAAAKLGRWAFVRDVRDELRDTLRATTARRTATAADLRAVVEAVTSDLSG